MKDVSGTLKELGLSWSHTSEVVEKPTCNPPCDGFENPSPGVDKLVIACRCLGVFGAESVHQQVHIPFLHPLTTLTVYTTYTVCQR